MMEDIILIMMATDFKTDDNWNSTGACVGGFEGYDNGYRFTECSSYATGDQFVLNASEFSFGLQINTIAGVSPCDSIYLC